MNGCDDGQGQNHNGTEGNRDSRHGPTEDASRDGRLMLPLVIVVGVVGAAVRCLPLVVQKDQNFLTPSTDANLSRRKSDVTMWMKQPLDVTLHNLDLSVLPPRPSFRFVLVFSALSLSSLVYTRFNRFAASPFPSHRQQRQQEPPWQPHPPQQSRYRPIQRIS